MLFAVATNGDARSCRSLLLQLLTSSVPDFPVPIEEEHVMIVDEPALEAWAEEMIRVRLGAAFWAKQDYACM